MELSDLSDLVLRLTSSALEVCPSEHQDNMIGTLRSAFQFDAAWWGWSRLADNRVSLVNTGRFRLPRSFESAVRAVSNDDPFIRYGRNLSVFAMSIETHGSNITSDFRNFLSAFQINSTLNGHCRLQGQSEFNFYMSLYRAADQPAFSTEETRDFRTILRHLEQSLSLALRAELAALAPARGEACLLTTQGDIVCSTRNFRANLLASGVRGDGFRRFMQQFASSGVRWHRYGIVMTSETYAPNLTLVRQSAAPAHRLSVEESKVADLYLSGLTMRQIAGQKGVALNTIRNQVASIYRKTGVSGKLALAATMMRER